MPSPAKRRATPSQKILRGSVAHDDEKPKNVSIPSKFETILGIGKKEEDGFNSRTYRFESEETEVPGPGHYNKPVLTDIQANSYAQNGYSNIMNKEKRWFDMPAPVYNFPGPGSYHTPDFISDMGKKSMNKAHGTPQFAPKFVPLITKKKETPGPGSYKPEAVLSIKPKETFQRKDFITSPNAMQISSPTSGPSTQRSFNKNSMNIHGQQQNIGVSANKIVYQRKPKITPEASEHVKSASIPNDRGVVHEGTKFKRPQPTEEDSSYHDPKTNREMTTQQTDVGGIRPPSPITSESTHYEKIGEIGFETQVGKFKHQPIDEQLPNSFFRSKTKREIVDSKLAAANPGPGTYDLPGAIDLRIPRKQGKSMQMHGGSNNLPLEYTKQMLILQQQEQQKMLLQAAKPKNPGVGQYELLHAKDEIVRSEKKTISASYFLSNTDRFGKNVNTIAPPPTKYNIPIDIYKKKSFRVTMGQQKAWNPV